VIVVVNKWDLVPEEALKRTERDLDQKLHHLEFAPRVYTSAINDYGIHDLLAEAVKLYNLWQTRVATGDLNRWLEVWQMRQATPNFKGKPLKMLYITQAETAPPTFVIFCNRQDFVTRAYEGFLTNRIREDLQLEGIPVRIVWRERGAFGGKKKGSSDDAEQASSGSSRAGSSRGRSSQKPRAGRDRSSR
jgi:GTP-binding protein